MIPLNGYFENFTFTYRATEFDVNPDEPIAIKFIHSGGDGQLNIDNVHLSVSDWVDDYENLWEIRWFSCDREELNDFTLQRDGTPVCGSGNCPGPPYSCWRNPYVLSEYESEPIDWTTGEFGELDLTHDKDLQVYGMTGLWVEEEMTIPLPVFCDVGAVWLNDAPLFLSSGKSTVELVLQPGPNRLEWTSYNQNSDTSFRLDFGLAQVVAIMHPYLWDVADVPAAEERLEIARLNDSWPNPFNPQSTISFDLPSETAVSLCVYDVSGRLVDVLVDGEMVQQGRNEVVWRGRDMSGRLMPSGTYFYRLEAGGYCETKRMTLLK